MKKGLLIFATVLVIISTLTCGMIAPVSAAEIPWEEVGSFSFKSMKVGTTSEKDGAYVDISTGLFDRVGLKGTGSVEIIKENGEVFARATATNAKKYVTLSCLPRETLPISTYRITLTYRFSEGMKFTDANRGFVARIWTGNASQTHDKQIVTKNTDLTGYTEWQTATVEIETKVKCSSIWFFVYAKAGEYFDVKDIKLEKLADPKLPESVNYDASKKQDLVIDCNLNGHVVDKIDDWSDEANVKVLDTANYVIAEDGKSITVKKEFMQTLKAGAKSLAFNINGFDYITVIHVYNSSVVDPPVKAGVIKTDTEPVTDPVTDPVIEPAPAQDNVAVIIAIVACAVAVIAVAMLIVVAKKKKA